MIVDEPIALRQHLQRCGGEALALDTEFLRERSYFAELCLVQLAGDAHAFCIDTLALTDLAALRELLGDRNQYKVMHAARQDLEVLWPIAGHIAPLYDTQAAAALCGQSAQVGYGELVSQLLGVKLDKAHTRTDWSRRPLTAEQLEYALDDVRHLLPLRSRLDAELARLGRTSWFDEEMRALEQLEFAPPDPALAWQRLKGWQELDSARLAVAKALCAWREQRAQTANRPRGWILPEVSLREIILRVPRSAAELHGVSELPDGTRERSGGEWLQLINELGLPAQLPPLESRRRPDPEQLAVSQRLNNLTRTIAGELQLAPELLATRRDQDAIAAGQRDCAPLRGWRRTVIGEPLLQTLA